MKDLLKLIGCWLAFLAAMFLSGVVTTILHFHPAVLPSGVSVQALFLTQLAAGVVLVAGLWPLARSLAAPPALRTAAFVAFLFFAFGVNGMIEAKKFTSFLDAGIGSAAVFYVCVAAFVGTAVGLLFGSAGQPSGLPRRNWVAWTWRVAAAWLGWPVIYFVFGMCVGPIVVPYYNAGVAGLRIPSMSVVIAIQLIRSPIFLLFTLPFVALWKGSRRGLWLALGIAHAFTIGLYGLVGAIFLPMVLRVAHTVEMTCDAFAYAGLLVLLFAAPAAKGVPAAPPLQDPPPQSL
ncbi:MAG: hypothetical protein ABSF23_03575 [Terracidiphilus sp.]|jgi:hypothetical protein